MCCDLCGVEERRCDPLGLAVASSGLADEHQRAARKEENVARVDGGDALPCAELHHRLAGGGGGEAGAVEEVEVVVGRDPDASRGVFVEPEDERFANALLGSEAMEAGAVVAEEAVLRCEPEQAGVVFFEAKEVEVAETLVLSVVAERELLGMREACT